MTILNPPNRDLLPAALAQLRRLYSRSRVLEMQCSTCLTWVKPRHFRTPAMVCRDCDAYGYVQTWTPSANRRASR